MSGKPEMPHGYLGPHGPWEELGLTTVTHNSPDMRCHECDLKITLKISKPTKVSALLLDASDESKKFKENVLVQTLNELVSLHIIFPYAGFFKMQIYALPASDPKTELPNVYNYLIQCTKAPQGTPVPFPAQFAQWKDGCYLFKPFILKNVDSTTIKAIVPGAKAVALCINEEWFPLQQRQREDGEKKDAHIPWSANLSDLLKFKGKAEKAVLTAHYPDDDETKYTSLLSYPLK
ncbi:hypothetical protein ACOMHN_064437 [Nucella lapillus]